MSRIIVGVSLYEDELLYAHVKEQVINNYKRQFADSPAQIRGCNHQAPPEANFCSKCGKPTWIDNPEIPRFRTNENICLSEFIEDKEYQHFTCEFSEYHCGWVIGHDINDIDCAKSINEIRREIADEFNKTFNASIDPSVVSFHSVIN